MSRQILFSGKGGIERALHRRINFRAGESAGSSRDPVEVKITWAPLPLAQLDRENLFALVLIRQVDEEKFVKASLPDELRRQTEEPAEECQRLVTSSSTRSRRGRKEALIFSPNVAVGLICVPFRRN